MESLERIFLSFFQASLAASVFILVVIFILKIFNNKLNIRVKNALWILVLIKLLIPVVTETNMNLFSILYDKYGSVVQAQDEVKNHIATSRQPEANQENLTNINNNDNYSNANINNKMQEDNKNLISFILKTASCVWLIGVVISSFAYLLFKFKLEKRIKGLKKYTNTGILTVVKECRHRINIKSRIPVFIYDGFKSPCILGIIKPKIYIPKYILNISDQNVLSHIFLHELMHYKRKDLFYNFLSIIVLLIHWFNPLVWFAVKKMKLYREYACDASVLEILKEEENIEYGMTLLNLSRMLLNKGSYCQAPIFFETKNQIRERILAIKEFKKGSYKMTTKAILACMAAAIIILTNNLAVKALDAENIIKTPNNVEKLSDNNKADADSTKNVKSNDKTNMKKSEQNIAVNSEADNITGYNGKWVQDNGKWYYYNSDGVMMKNVKIDGYALGEDGAWIDNDSENKKPEAEDKTKTAVTDKTNDSENKSLKSGSIVENNKSNSNNDYNNQVSDSTANSDVQSVKADNSAQSNTTVSDNHTSTDAYKQSDKRWKKDGNNWTYTTKDGQKVTGWLFDEKEWYHFNNNGVMDKNTTITDDYGKYELREDGTLKNRPNK